MHGIQALEQVSIFQRYKIFKKYINNDIINIGYGIYGES